MKVGVRKPSVSKRVKARTTGRAKRAVKKAVIPYYGAKGIGIIKNPKKAVYNKVYRKTTVGVDDFVAVAASNNGRKRSKANEEYANQANPKNLKAVSIILIILSVFFFMVAAVGLLAEVYSLLLIGLISGVFSLHYARKIKNGLSTDTEIVDDVIKTYADSDINDDNQPDITIEVETFTED